MKKSLIFAAVICLLSTTVLKAQDPGNMYISGSISMAGNSTTAVYGTESSKEPGGFTMSLTPQFGIFVIENLEVHLGLGYSFTRDPEVDINSSGDQVINSTNINLFTITPGINYYVPIVEYKFYYTPGLDLSVGFGGFVDGLAGGLICGLFLLIPYLTKGAGGGDLKMISAAGTFTGLRYCCAELLFISLTGLLLGLIMLICGRVKATRLKHWFRTIFDWRYDRREGAASLPDKSDETLRIPFGVAIAAGTVITLIYAYFMEKPL